MMSAVAMLEVENVSTIRGRVQVLWDVSLQVARGETVAIVGPNGAGKTTLVGSITGLIPPSAGRIHIGGVDVTGQPPERLAARRVALVPERRGIFAPLTVRENFLMGAYARHERRAALDAGVADILELFPPLRRYVDTIAGSLSGGEQQMVAIGRALMSRPRLLLMDEPSMGLSPALVQQNFQIIKQVNETGVAMLMVEQNANMALSIADRGYVLATGELVLADTAANLLASEDLKRAYLGH